MSIGFDLTDSQQSAVSRVCMGGRVKWCGYDRGRTHSSRWSRDVNKGMTWGMSGCIVRYHVFIVFIVSFVSSV